MRILFHCNSDKIFRSQDIIDLTLIDNLPSSLHGKHKIKKPSTVNAPSSSKTKNNVTNKYSTTQSSKSTEKNSVTNESNSVQQQSPPRLTHSFKELRRSHVKDGRPFNLGKMFLICFICIISLHFS